MAVCSDSNPFSVEEGLIFGFPIICENGSWKFAKDITVSDKVREKLNVTTGMCLEINSFYSRFEEGGFFCGWYYGTNS